MNVELILTEVTVDPRDGCAVVMFAERGAPASSRRVFPLWVDDDTAKKFLALIDGRAISDATLLATSTLVTNLGGQLRHAELVAIQNGNVQAQIVVRQGAEETTVQMRASDAILLAIDQRAPLWIQGDLLGYVQIRMAEAEAWMTSQESVGEDIETPVSIADRWAHLLERYRHDDEM